jgi:hypothetical protein
MSFVGRPNRQDSFGSPSFRNLSPKVFPHDLGSFIQQIAEVALSQELFAAILGRIGKLRLLVEASG